MMPKEHVIYGGAACAALYPAFGPCSVFFWIASVAIDLDHYLDFVYHGGFKDLSFMRMFGYHDALRRSWHLPEFLNLEIFHTVEFIAPFLLLTLWSGSLVMEAAFWGFIFHIALDMVSLYRNGIFFKRTYSFAEYFIRRRRLEERGLSPVEVYSRAFRIAGGSDEKIP